MKGNKEGKETEREREWAFNHKNVGTMNVFKTNNTFSPSNRRGG